MSENKTDTLTVAALAASKKVPASFLSQLELKDLPGGGVAIPYFDMTGMEIAVKRRTALHAKDGSYWPKGRALEAYGQWKLDKAARTRDLLLVEGESDCWALWYSGFPTLGIPGANAVKVLQKEHIEAVDRIYVHREPDNGGSQFVEGVQRRLKELGFAGEVLELRMPPGVKDPADLHALDPQGFFTAMGEALRMAKLISQEPEPAASARSADGKLAPEVGSVTTICGKDVKVQRLRWLWQRYFPLGKLTIVDGDPGAGKSTVLTDIAARVTQGKGLAPTGEPIEVAPAPVVILATEDDPGDTIIPRLSLAGADLGLIHIVRGVQTQDGTRCLELPLDIERLEECITRTGARLLILDPIFVFSAGFDPHKDAETRRAFQPLVELLGRTGCAGAAIRHMNKAQGLKSMYRGGGSIALNALARGVLMVGQDPDDPAYGILAVVKASRSGKAESLRFRLVPELMMLNGEQDEICRIEWCGSSHITADDLVLK